MHLDLIQSLSIAGKSTVPNDDRIGAADRHAWVIDGATDLGEPGLLGERGGAAWLAATADRYLSSASGSLLDICDIAFTGLSDAYRRERRRDPVAEWEVPCAAFAAIAIEGDFLACAFAGDCTVLHHHGGGVSFLTPPPDRRAESAQALALGEGATAEGVRSPAVLADRRAARSGPRRVLSIDAAASRDATEVRRAPVARGDDIVLMSDGFAALLDAYDLYAPDTFMQAMAERGLTALAEELRSIERDDLKSIRFPRFKPSDDASAIWLRVG